METQMSTESNGGGDNGVGALKAAMDASVKQSNEIATLFIKFQGEMNVEKSRKETAQASGTT
jgi:hypothetical protein